MGALASASRFCDSSYGLAFAQGQEDKDAGKRGDNEHERVDDADDRDGCTHAEEALNRDN